MATMGEENLKEQLAVLQAKLAVLEKQLLQGQQDVIRETVKEVLSQTQKRDGLQQEVMFKFRRSRKDLIKQKMVDSCREKQMTVPELKFMIVDQMGYASKATFYRYLAELAGVLDTSGQFVRVAGQVRAQGA
ncbi:hypothetical protein AUJ68_03130 [Candidatus Woesearchaeota archaeon CG1_02_57_44]|nr:MAG: hypothetical protein AUJ68_03130 [Candidatus Woesearchaeota archaeon CG1_02_57_44]